jgi:peptidoglycan/xylan/chitin deacetylase (PgdA/CDA1 family)
MQKLYPNVLWRKNEDKKVVYLTFDDGPVPECTPQILDILAQYGVKATFFMVADNAQRFPVILESVRQQGHAVGNHTYHHMKGCQNTLQTYMLDVEKANQVLRTHLFRPPHGRMKASQKQALLQQGYTICMWDVLTHDYNPRYTVERMMAIVQKYVRNGSIITCHDSRKSIDRVPQLLHQMIPYLLAEGYEFRTL